jgi:aminoglycoside 3-N-acetyltransferase
MRLKTIKGTVKQLLPDYLLPHCQYALQKNRAWLKRLDYTLDRRTLSLEESIHELKKLGITLGATVYLHSSMDEIRRRVPDLEVLQFINLLKELIGKEGTLLVPTFPFTGLQYDYVQKQRVFDVKRTSSRVGLFTELFRRTEGVIRSLHPTHPVAAWGKHSEELVRDHHLGTAFGETSPIYKMQQYDGLLAGIGVIPKHCFTLYHVAEELHPTTRAMQYGTDTFEMTIIHGEEKIPYQVTPLRPDRVRGYGRADQILQREGILRYYTVKGLKFSATSVRQFLQRCQGLIDANLFYS